MNSSTHRQLMVFRAVVDTGSFSAAAKALAISQPSVSEHVRALEIHFREPLLERKRGKTPTLTDAGQRIYDYAGTTLAEAERIDSALGVERTARDRVLSFAAHMFVADRLMPPILQEFSSGRTLEVIANVGRSDAVIEQVKRHEVDLGLILSREPVVGLDFEVIGSQPLVFIASPNHPLTRRKRVSLDEVANYPFIVPKRDSDYGRRHYSMLAEIGITNPKIGIQTPDMRFWYGMVKSSDNLSVAIRARVEDELASGELAALDVDIPPFRLDVVIVWSDERRMTSTSRHFLEFLRRRGGTKAFVG